MARNEKQKKSKIWWRQRTKMEKICVVLIATVLVIFVGQLIKFIYTRVTVREVCTEAACVEAAAEMLQIVDFNANPCDDFYKYACGNFLKDAFLKESPSPFAALEKKSQNQMISIIMDDQKKDDVKSVKAMKILYKACMNMTAIEENDGKGLLDLLEELGGWPILKGKTWKDADFNWLTASYKSKNLGFEQSVFVLFIPYESRYGTLPFIRPPTLGKTFKIGMKEDYIDYVTDIASFLGASKYYAPAEIRKMADFEEQLQKIFQEITQTNDFGDEPEPITFEKLQNISPHIAWLDFINNITQPSHIFNEKDFVIFTAEEYVRKLLSLLTKTPKRTQANYFMWKIVQSNLNYLKQDVLVRKMNYTLLTRGLKEQDKEERYKTCTQMITQEIVPFAAEAAFARKYTTQNLISDVQEMTQYLKTETEILLKRNNWMDATTKNLALKKLERLKILIGGPEETLNGRKFDKILGYDKIDLQHDNFIKLAMEIRRRFKEFFYRKFSENATSPEVLLIWQSLVKANAYYIKEKNAILLPAALLQGIFYNAALPKYYNFGTIGSIIGHELLHAFTEEGSTYGSDGAKGFWWSNETLKAYQNKVFCLVDAYSKYKTKEAKFKLDGDVTLKENACDFGGAKIAHGAYQKWLSKNRNEDEPVLPGTKSTPVQLFWTVMSFYRCHQKTPKDDILAAFDVHAVPSFRVNAPLRNTELFSEDFGCHPDTYMNPTQKCTLF